MVLSHQISIVVFWPLSWRHKKRLHPLFLGGSNLNLKRPKSWEILMSSLYFFQPQSYSSFEIWIEGKPQATKILIVWVMFFCFRRICFGKRICKLHRYVFRHVTYWIHLATHRGADVEEALAEGFPVAWFTSLQALINLISYGYPFSHFMCRKSQLRDDFQTLISMIVITFHVVCASFEKIDDF